MITGNQLRRLRKMHDIKQREMAKKLCITQQAYSNLEKKKWINGEKILKILDAFDYTKEQLENALKNLPQSK